MAMDVKVYNQEGKETGSVTLNPDLFGIEPNKSLVHQYIVNYLARQRQGTSSTKTRKDVRGGGRKPWRQKGTGRARAGTIRSPLWRGGGIVFGPHPRKYGSKFPKKMKSLALKSIFSDKALREKIKVVDFVSLSEIKTKAMVDILSNLNLSDSKCLLLDEGINKNVLKSCSNLKKIQYCRASLTNGYDMLYADYLLFTKSGLEEVEKVFA